MQNRREWRDGLLIAAAVAAAYASSTACGFHLDDFPNIVENRAIASLSGIGELFRFFPSRVIVFLSFALNHAIHGLKVSGYHAVNITIHIAAALSVWRLAEEIFRTPKGALNKPSNGTQDIALAAGLFFALHPLQTQAVTYIYQRAASLSALFYIATVLYYLKARNNGGKTSLFSMSAVFALLGTFSKENCYTIPVMLAACEALLYGRPDKAALKRLAWFFLIAAVGAAAMRSSETYIDIAKISSSEADITPLQYLLTQTRVLCIYLKLVLLPFGQNLLYDIPLSRSLFEWKVIACSGALAALAYGAVRSWKRGNAVIPFCAIWFLVAQGTESSLIPLQDVIFEHRMYLPMAGLSVLAGYLFSVISKRARRAAFIAAVAVAAVLALLTWQRNRIWESELTLWRDNVSKTPNLPPALNNLAVAQIRAGNPEEAEQLLTRAIAINPKYTQSYNNLAFIKYSQGDTDSAARLLYRAAANQDDADKAYNNIGNICRSRGQYRQAEDAYRKAIDKNSDVPIYHANLGLTYYMQEKYAEAALEYKKAAALEPDNPGYHAASGKALYKTGDRRAAVSEMETALRLDSSNAELRSELEQAAQADNKTSGTGKRQ